MTHRNRSRVEAIARKITPIKGVLQEDERGDYLGICNFHCHPGIVGIEKAKYCEEIMCSHYEKFYKK